MVFDNVNVLLKCGSKKHRDIVVIIFCIQTEFEVPYLQLTITMHFDKNYTVRNRLQTIEHKKYL